MSAFAKRLTRLRVTLMWASGLLIILALGTLWLYSLGAAIFRIYRAHGRDEVVLYVIVFALILFALGRALVWFFNGFYEWHVDQRLNSVLAEIDESVPKAQAQLQFEKLAPDFSSEFTDTFKEHLRSSPAFQRTVTEAMNLVKEAAAFASTAHSEEQSVAFQSAWKAKTEKLAERIAQDDPLAVEVILKAIEKESEKVPKS